MDVLGEDVHWIRMCDVVEVGIRQEFRHVVTEAFENIPCSPGKFSSDLCPRHGPASCALDLGQHLSSLLTSCLPFPGGCRLILDLILWLKFVVTDVTVQCFPTQKVWPDCSCWKESMIHATQKGGKSKKQTGSKFSVLINSAHNHTTVFCMNSFSKTELLKNCQERI